MIGRLRLALQLIVAEIARALRWINSIDIPLSPLQWILAFYLVFGIVYMLATPVFEANDEIWHFGYMQHLRETGTLPELVFDGKDTIYQQHGGQPPLYYGLMSLLTAPIDIDDVDGYRRLNPYTKVNNPDSYGNKNLIIHDESLSTWGGTGLVVLITRGLGLALGAGTIVFVYKISVLVAPQRPTVAFVAAAITGLNPMFIFVSASVNNDALAMALNGGLVLLTLRTLRDGFNWRYSTAIALLFALACLTKLTSLVLLPVLIGVALYIARKTRDRRGLLIFLYLLALCWLLIAGWWYVRNMQLYGEPFGIITMANIAGPRSVTFNFPDLFAEFQQFRMSYWGLFGALNIQVTGIFYVLLDLMTFFSAIGCIFLILQLLAISDFAYARYELTHLVTMVGALTLLSIGVLYWGTLTPALEGRTLFPLIAVVSPLLAVGFVEVVWWIVFSLRPPNLEFVRAGDAVPKELLHDTMLWQLRFLGLVALLVPFSVIAGQYDAPQPVSALPARALPVYAEFGDVALVAYERSDRRYSTGDNVHITLYWQVLQQSDADNSILLTFVDDNRQEIGRYTTYPGAGSLRTSGWKAGATYPDEYIIGIEQAAYGRYPFDLQVEWENTAVAENIAATNADQELIAPVLLDIGAVVTTRYQATATGFSEIPVDDQPKFDEAVRLESLLVDLELNEVVLNWTAESSTAEDYTVFAHLLDDEGNIVAQDDRQPRLPTVYWRWGESYSTIHRFPASFNLLDHALIVGLYINDGLSYPRAEYIMTVDEEDLVFDSFTIPWEISEAVLALTPQATTEGDDDQAPSEEGLAEDDAEPAQTLDAES